MASLVFKNGYVSLGGTDISSKVKSVTLTWEVEQVDDTTMGDSTKSSTPGLENWSVSIEPRSDFADNDLDEDIWALKGTTFEMCLRPVNGAISDANPEYRGNAMISSYQVMGGSVGELSMSPISLVPSKGSGSATLVRDVTP